MHPTSYGNTIRVILADDHSTFREFFEKFLRKNNEIEVVATAADGEELIHLVEKEKPHVVVTDLRMPNLDGIEVTKILKKRFPEIGIIAFTLYSDDYFILGMLQAGGDGYLLKNIYESEIVDAIKAVYRKGMYYCNAVSNRLLKLLPSSKISSRTISNHELSEREIQVMQLICQELSNKEIASKLKMSVRTVEHCRERIQEKIGAKNMVGIVTYAIKSGIYDIG
jgi:DNA-binding NarL/FixJ family response regulator